MTGSEKPHRSINHPRGGPLWADRVDYATNRRCSAYYTAYGTRNFATVTSGPCLPSRIA